MQCMKCGRELPAGQIFCDDCLDVMERYPVKPGTVIQLPSQSRQPQTKKNISRRRAVLSPEEQVVKLKRRVRILAAALVLVMAAAAAAGYLAVRQYLDNVDKVLPGQNYSTITDTTPPTGK